MYTLKEKIANKGNYGSKRALSDIKYIVIHYTGNDGDTDEANATYFAREKVQVSAHYFVDSDSVTRSVPDDYIAWHCGAYSYKHKYCRNANSIGIEICDDNYNGKIYPSEKTIDNAVELTKKLMKEYGIPKENVIRHYDVSGKECPYYWCGSTSKNSLWKTEFWNKLTKEDKKETQKFKIGDKVVINGNLFKTANDTKASSSIKNKTTKITRFAKGTKHPYNTTGDLGWMNESDISAYKKETYTTMTVQPSCGLFFHYAKKWNSSTRSGIWKKGTKVKVVNGSDYRYGDYIGCQVYHNGTHYYCAKNYLK